MATSKKALDAALREKYVKAVTDFFTTAGEEVLRVETGTLAIPCVNDAGDDDFIRIVISVPTGSRDGDPWDGYGLAEAYNLKIKNDEEKAKEAEAKKAAKIAKDKAQREAKAKAKADHEKTKKAKVE